MTAARLAADALFALSLALVLHHRADAALGVLVIALLLVDLDRRPS